MTIHLSDLSGPKLKKALNLKRAVKRWHNKNNTGGNFGINLQTQSEKWHQYTGYYNVNQEITGLTISEIYQPGAKVITSKEYKHVTLSRLFEITEEYIR